MNQELYEKIEKMITEYVAQHPESFLDATKAIDDLVNESMETYNAAQERIRKEIISDPHEIKDPEQEMRDRLAIERVRIEAELAQKLSNYQKTFANK